MCMLLPYRRARLANSLRTRWPWLPLNADIALCETDECRVETLADYMFS